MFHTTCCEFLSRGCSDTLGSCKLNCSKHANISRLYEKASVHSHSAREFVANGLIPIAFVIMHEASLRGMTPVEVGDPQVFQHRRKQGVYP